MKGTWFGIVIFAGLLLAGCKGPDGERGAVFLALHRDRNVTYSDNNPSLPATDTTGYYYACEPGSYHFTYRYYLEPEFYREYSGDYTLTANEGERGSSFWTAGTPGRDRFYDLYCYVDGSDFKGIRIVNSEPHQAK